MGGQRRRPGVGSVAPDFQVLARAFNADHMVPRALSDPSLADACRLQARALRRSRTPLVYTAFDGDIFELTPQMRAWVTRQGWVPANPENIVGYKDSVEAHNGKAGVLIDDLAIVTRCDHLCIFTDVAPEPAAALGGLAEGVIVELLYFLAHNQVRQPAATVTFVPVANLLGGDEPAEPYKYDYTDTVARLAADQRGIALLLASIDSGAVTLPKVAYVAHDPLDAKYVHWLRPFGYARKYVPLVPTLALRLADMPTGAQPELASGRLLAARLRLLDLADELWVLPSQDLSRDESYTAMLTKSVWNRRPVAYAWRDLGVPKELDARWALTARESSILVDADEALSPVGLT